MRVLSICLVLALAGCATPVTTLENKNGDVVTCGGGTAGAILGGFAGYVIQEGHDRECVDNYKAQGYSVK